MIDLLIDAALLACPSEDIEDKEFNSEFLSFVIALTELSRFRRSFSSSKIWRESSLASTLFMINAYPFKHALARAMPRLDPSLGFQLEDISSLALAILTKSNCLNEFIEIEDVVVENGEITNDPVVNRRAELMEYACRVTEFAFCHLGSSTALPSSVRFTSRTPKDANTFSVLRYEVPMTSYKDGSMHCSGFTREIELACFCGNELTLRDLDPVSIWMKADEPSLLDALAIFAANQDDISHCKLLEFKEKLKIRDSMLSSCRHLGFLHEPTKIRRLIAACVDICLDRNLAQSHWLRRDKGANDPQKTRANGGFAWRHDIDNEFHLHYWRNGAAIEFANVVVHNDFSITE